jgi:diaminohydroxyphosphoribosylaminopyrimidine deaminase/5-amino-6-(5-phosphoribosylamino)uracil reductase
MKSQDTQFMQRALQLAEKALGQTSPNPMVGAVLVKSGKIIAEGFHRKAGTDHAEIVALKAAGLHAKGATLYVSLEPCCHHGRTGPCTEAIIRSKIKRVVYAMKDPNPVVAGKGLAQLRKAGITIDGPVCEDEVRFLNRAYCHWMTTGMPYVLAKVAITIDGKMADAHGKSRWITNTKARSFSHYIRAMVDAIVVGSGTAMTDNPQLTARSAGKMIRQPVAVVLDSRGRLPKRLAVFQEGRSSPTLLISGSKIPKSFAAWLSSRGHNTVAVGLKGRHVNLRKALRHLAGRDMTMVMVEGGPTLIGALAKDGLIQEWIFCIAPKFLGQSALGLTSALPDIPIARAKELLIRQVVQMDNNVVIVATQT